MSHHVCDSDGIVHRSIMLPHHNNGQAGETMCQRSYSGLGVSFVRGGFPHDVVPKMSITQAIATCVRCLSVWQ